MIIIWRYKVFIYIYIYIIIIYIYIYIYNNNYNYLQCKLSKNPNIIFLIINEIRWWKKNGKGNVKVKMRGKREGGGRGKKGEGKKKLG